MTGPLFARKSTRNNVYLVTGATGFLGSHLVRRLAQRQKTRVIGLDIKRQDSAAFAQAFPSTLSSNFTFIEELDVQDFAAIKEALEDARPDYLIHLAGQSQIRDATQASDETMAINYGGTKKIINAITAGFSLANYPALVLASSDKAYGSLQSHEFPCVEETPRRPIGPYAVSKSKIINFAEKWASEYKMPILTTCLANVYGPGDFNWGRVIPATFRRLFYDEPIKIFRHHIGEGQYVYPTREFISLEATLRAYDLMIEHSKNPDLRGQHFNFGSGQAVEIRTLLKTVCRVAEKAADNIAYVDLKGPLEAPGQRMSSEKAMALGWQGETTPLEQGLQEACEWYFRLFENNPETFSKSRC